MRNLGYILTFGLLLTAGRAKAIAVADYSVAETNPAAAGYALNWDFVYQYKNASSVAVDHYWILTAAHVADDGPSGNLNVNGETYSQQEIVFHPSADLALVRYDKPFSGYYPLYSGEIYTGSGRNRVYQELVIAGYGFDGTVSATSFSEGTSRKKRWGTNRGVSEASYNTDVGGTVGSVSTMCFRMNFNLTDTDFEAGANVYDSGGPVFIESGGVWKLTGIALYRPSTSENRAALIPDYINWIKSVIVDYDTDMDGLPDWWETQYGPLNPEDDPDLDGFSNYQEWLADTVPTSGSSFLALTAYTNATALSFNSSTNRRYQVECTAGLTNSIWNTVGGWVAGTHPQTTVAVVPAGSNCFYRVRAALP